MIDTIRLLIESEYVDVFRPEYFTPHFNLSKLPYYYVSHDGFLECKQLIPPKKLLKNNEYFGVYFPRIKFKRIPTGRGVREFLKIEFSVPKLLFGNNFYEVINSDIDKIVQLLKNRLFHMGVNIDSDALLYAQVVGIHFGKNVILDGYAHCQTVLSEIAKANITTRLELGQTEYRNDGYLVRFRANSYELFGEISR